MKAKTQKTKKKRTEWNIKRCLVNRRFFRAFLKARNVRVGKDSVFAFEKRCVALLEQTIATSPKKTITTFDAGQTLLGETK